MTPATDVSAKGIKAGTTLTIASGVYTLDCSDDAIHANADVTISGGSYTIATGDDAVHADGTLTVTGGTLNIPVCYEGLEGSDVVVSGGEIFIVSDDDGINAAGGNDASGFGGHGMGNTFSSEGASHAITISGGSLNILSGGDGLDSNGALEMIGGTLSICSTGSDDSALDYESSYTLEGSTLFAASAGNMNQALGTSGQCILSVSFGQTLEAGTNIQFLSDDKESVFQLTGSASSAVFSSPELASGAVCSISHGGTYSDGIYTGGTTLAEITLEDGLTTYGQTGGGKPSADGGAPSGGGTPPNDGETQSPVPTT